MAAISAKVKSRARARAFRPGAPMIFQVSQSWGRQTAAIRAAFAEKHGSATTIIIAQRITSVMDADRIVVLQDGEIDGVGTHEELMAANEIYRDVYTSQQKGVA